MTVANIADALDLLGAAYRGDWSDFDGRTLHAQLNELAESLRQPGPAGDFDLRRWAYSSSICPESRCWLEHCPEPAPSGRRYSCAHAEAFYAEAGLL